MSRPRFYRLPVEQQNVILDAALQEFTVHGFGAASLNRIIEVAGTSKGAMYYYFDGKEDLYADVIRRQLESLLKRGGPLPVPAVSDPDMFWAILEEYYLRLMRLLAEAPETGALLRDWLIGAASPALRTAQRDTELATQLWLMQTVAAGQQIGAVRADLPSEFLVALVIGMGIDTWLITVPPEVAELADVVHALIGTMRRAIQT